MKKPRPKIGFVFEHQAQLMHLEAVQLLNPTHQKLRTEQSKAVLCDGAETYTELCGT